MTDLGRMGVVVTRAASQSGELIDAISRAGGEVIALPLLEIVPPPDGGASVAEAVEGLTGSEWLAVLSPNGAQSVVANVSEPAVGRLAVVAEGTAAPLEEAGWSIDLLPEVPTAEGLADALRARERPGRCVVVQAAGGRSTLEQELRENGWDVEVVVGYVNTVPDLAPDAVAAARRADIVVFASPSAVERYREHVGLHPAVAACIGPVTEHAARVAGFETVVASEPTVPALVDALGRRLGPCDHAEA